MAGGGRKRPKKEPKPKRHKKPPEPKPKPEPAKTTNEELKDKSTQSGPAAMNATPGSMAEAQGSTAAAVYSTGPGDVVAYDYERTGTYADAYNEQQQVDVSGGAPSAT